VDETIPETALKHLLEDFSRLSEMIGESVCVVEWSESEQVISEDAMGCVVECSEEVMAEEVLEFLSRYNEVVYNERLWADSMEIDSAKQVRRRVLDPEFVPWGLLETLPGRKACVWWSMPIADTYLGHVDLLSEKAVKLLGSHCPGVATDIECEPRIRWIEMARHIVHSDFWYMPHSEIVLEPPSDDEIEAAERFRGREDYPEWEDARANSPIKVLDELAGELRYRFVTAMRTAGKTLHRIRCDNLGNPASYSASAIELKLRAIQRSDAERQAAECADVGVTARPETREEQTRLLRMLLKSEKIEKLFEEGGRELLSYPDDKAFSLKQLAKLAGLSAAEASMSSFKEPMRSLKIAGVFERIEGPYILREFGRDLLRYFLKEDRQARAKPGPGRG